MDIPRWTLRSRFSACLLFGLIVSAMPAYGQAERSATIRGEVRTPDGAPVVDALVQLEQEGADMTSVRTLDNGNFTMPRLASGEYVLIVRRLGFNTERRDLTLTAGVARISVVLSEKPGHATDGASLGAFVGLSGTVGDFARMEPLKGASISRMGGGEPVTTDADGRFLLPIDQPGVGAIRVERAGFEPRLISYAVHDSSHVQLSVLLDSGSVSRNDAFIWRELDLRSKWSTPRTVRVPRSELATTDSRSLLSALEQSPSVQASGVIFTRAACVFVNGQPRPGFPLDAIRADLVEYVEAFPVRTELSRTLLTRWPSNGVCGAPGGDLAVRRAIESGQGAQFVSVWLR